MVKCGLHFKYAQFWAFSFHSIRRETIMLAYNGVGPLNGGGDDDHVYVFRAVYVWIYVNWRWWYEL